MTFAPSWLRVANAKSSPPTPESTMWWVALTRYYVRRVPGCSASPSLQQTSAKRGTSAIVAGVDVVICHPRLVETGLDSSPSRPSTSTKRVFHVHVASASRVPGESASGASASEILSYANTMQSNCIRLMAEGSRIDDDGGQVQRRRLAGIEEDTDMMSAWLASW